MWPESLSIMISIFGEQQEYLGTLGHCIYLSMHLLFYPAKENIIFNPVVPSNHVGDGQLNGHSLFQSFFLPIA